MFRMSLYRAPIIIAAGIVVAGSIAITTAWTGATSTPPAGNVNPPINTGSTAQTKAGDLGVNAFLASGNTSLLGNVGIGTASPSQRLHLEESGQFAQMLWRAGTGSNKDLIMHYGENSTAGNQFRLGRYTRAGTWEANPVWFDMDAPGNSLTINENGYLGVGVGSATQRLDVAGNAHLSGGIFMDDIYPTNGTGQQYYFQNWDGTFYISNSTNYGWTSNRFWVDSSGNVTAGGYFHFSDARLKDHIATINNGLDFIKQLRGVTFTWKKDGKPSVGLIAQEVEHVFPSAVSVDKMSGIKSVDYDQLIAPMIEAIKEQQKQIDAQNKKITALEHEIEILKASR